MEFILPLIILIFSAIIHEVAHGWVANKLGDPTARLMGRLTLNPIPHIDLISSVLVPLMLILLQSPIIFGAAKPVPINPNNFEDEKKDTAISALAGPGVNIILAISAALLIKIIGGGGLLASLLHIIVIYNLLLAIINLIPIPPLDGSKVFAAFLPDGIRKSYLSLEPFGIFILLFLLLMPVGGFSLGDLINNLLLLGLKLLGI